MQTKLSNYILKDKLYIFNKRVLEIVFSFLFLLITFFFLGYFFLRKLFKSKKIFIEEKYFLSENKTIKIKLFNTNISFIKNCPIFYYIFTSQISLVGVALVKYRKNINYKVVYKPAVFSLWFIRNNSKMTNCTISSCNKEYILNQGFLNDCKILLKSIITLLYYSSNKKINKKVEIFDIRFDNLKMSETMNLIEKSVLNLEKKVIYFINADCLNKTFKNEKYKKILKDADFILPDGSGINIACNILETPLCENINGTDMLPHLCSLSQKKSFTIFLLGAQTGVASKMKYELLKKYPNINIVGTHHGFLENKSDKEEAISYINSLNPDIVLVAMGAPYQETFINKYKNILNTKVIIGVGGLFDFYSTNIKRAPLYLRETGFEWVYRMIQEPKRMWKRYILGNPLFIFRVIAYKKELEKNSLLNTYLNTYDKKTEIKYKKYFWKLNNFSSILIKRTLDIVASFILLILFVPLFLTISMIIKFTSKGNIVFVQKRVGQYGKLFNMYKFRSMVVDAEELKEKLMEQNQSKDGVIFKMKDDPRITKIGKFIRKTSIDELPQLLNVLKGEMSLVGPRPPVIEEVKQYNMDDKKRLDVKPGITCIWQVSGRSTIPFKQQVQMDKEYIKSQSIYMDIVLLLKTIPAVLFQKGSC